jgi:O-antigen ligase
MLVVVLFRGRSLAWAKTYLMLAIYGLLVYGLFFIFIPPYLGLEHEPSTVIQRLGNDGLMGRDRLWGRALELWIGQPIFGIGPQQYAVFELQNSAAHPHSAPLQWLSEWGIISFCIVSALLFWGAIAWLAFSRKFVNEATAQQSVILISVTASLVAGSVHGLVSGIIVMPLSQLTMCLVVGWALAIYHGSCRTAGVREQPRSSEQRGLVILVLLLTATLAATSYPEIAMGERRTSSYTDSHPEEKWLRPRFWQQGYIGW